MLLVCRFVRWLHSLFFGAVVLFGGVGSPGDMGVELARERRTGDVPEWGHRVARAIGRALRRLMV